MYPFRSMTVALNSFGVFMDTDMIKKIKKDVKLDSMSVWEDSKVK